MATSVRGKNLEITAALKDYVLKHEKKIMKYFDTDVALQAMLSVEKERKIAELTLRVDGVVLRVVETGEDMYAAIDIVFDKMVRQIHNNRPNWPGALRTGPSSRPLSRNLPNRMKPLKL